MLDPLEQIWNQILSRQPDQIRQAYSNLNPVEQRAVLEHLRVMATEPGWHQEQRLSAQAALETIEAIQ
jgi:hypothetical protein